MKTVSANWITDFNKQLRPETNVEVALVSNPKIKSVAKTNANNVLWRCADVIALGGYFDISSGGITINFASAIEVNQNDVKIEGVGNYGTGISPKNMFKVSFKSGNTTLGTFTVQSEYSRLTIKPSTLNFGILTNVDSIYIKPYSSSSLGSSYSFDIEYLSLVKLATLTKKDYQILNYKAHVSPTNEDLPYQNISFEMLGKNEILSTKTVAVAHTYLNGRKSERVKLGCGYYYLSKQEYKRQENKTYYEFVDLISTLNQKFIWGELTQGAGTYNGSVSRRVKFITPDNQTARDLTFSELLNLMQNNGNMYVGNFKDFPTTMFPNPIFFRNTSDNLASLMSVPCNYPENKTCAEVLQMIAQSIGYCLYLNGYNQIIFDKLTYNYQQTYTSFVANNILEKVSVENRERIGSFTLTRHILLEDDNDATFIDANIEPQAYDVSGTTVYAFATNVDKIISVATPTTDSTYWVLKSAYYYVCLEANNDPIRFIAQTRYSLGLFRQETTIVDKNYDTAWNIDLPLSFGNAGVYVDTVVPFYKNLAYVKKDFQVATRFDPRFEIGDFVKFDEANKYFKTLLTDIDMTYNGGFSANLNGMIWQENVLEPIVEFNKVSNYSITITNPNDFDCDLAITINDTSVDTHHYTLPAFGSITLSSASGWTELDDMVDNYLGGDCVGTSKFVSAYLVSLSRFEKHTETSANSVVILDGTLLPPQIIGLDLFSGFKLKNNNPFTCDWKIGSNGDWLITGSITANDIIELTPSGYTWINLWFFDYRSGILNHDVEVEFVCNGETNVITLLKANHQ